MRYCPLSPLRAVRRVPVTVISAAAMPCPVRASVTRPVTVPPWTTSAPFRTNAIWPLHKQEARRPASEGEILGARATEHAGRQRDEDQTAVPHEVSPSPESLTPDATAHRLPRLQRDDLSSLCDAHIERCGDQMQ